MTAGKYDLWRWFSEWTYPCVKVHIWHLVLERVMQPDRKACKDGFGYSSDRRDKLHTMWSSLGTDQNPESTVNTKGFWESLLTGLVQQTALTMVTDQPTRAKIEKVLLEQEGGSVCSKPSAERGAVYASHLAKVREVIIAACRVEVTDPAVGLVTPHTKQMAAESENIRGKAYSSVHLTNLKNSKVNKSQGAPPSNPSGTVAAVVARTTTYCGNEFSKDWVESAKKIRDVSDMIDRVNSERKQIEMELRMSLRTKGRGWQIWKGSLKWNARLL